MTPGLAAMLAGVFVIPGLLLWGGHRLRRRSPRWRAAFWGALIAHSLFAPAAMVAAMVPPVEWSAADTVRGLFGFWSLLVAPIVGAALAVALRGRVR
jgi:hypothetical protein